jgi:hypothetical protein
MSVIEILQQLTLRSALRGRIGNPLSNVKSGTSLSPEGGPAKSRLTFTTTSQ